MLLRKKLHFLALYEFLPLGFGDFCAPPDVDSRVKSINVESTTLAKREIEKCKVPDLSISFTVAEGSGRRVAKEVALVQAQVVCLVTPYWSKANLFNSYVIYVIQKSECAVLILRSL